MDNNKEAGHYVFDSNSDEHIKSRSIVSDISFKNLVRIPVWAIYSLIIATVIISFIILTEIWFPNTIDEELIWKIALTYGVFLMSALVISNLTDRVKEINKSS
ncbi:MAG: hypothetical protein GW903_09140 [Alphaproteobacteria bacterium]|nr:hypothetical protein [Alphaproteobacteria bacterium]NCQ89087.1 hypothetical protein [Alphaproteobacteria bacterium]NCT07987.1 hypothetical protein [Alphaproteobacteria bacterium]